MPQSLSDLEQRRELIARRLTGLGDLRLGSITATSGRCGKPECHCHQPGQPGHGPNFRLTYKVDGKTISEALPTPAAIQKAEREVEEFRKFQQLTREFLGTNTEICRLRPLEEESETELKKNDRSDTSRAHARSRRVLAGGVRRATQDRAPRSGSDRDGHALGSTPSAGQPAHTREVKLGCVFTQTKWDQEGYPIRDPDSTTYTGAIESAEEFGRRIYAEAWGRGWSRALQKVVIGDGAEWIWNLVGLHFPGATQIVDLYHARQHLWEVARRLFPNEGRRKAKSLDEDPPEAPSGSRENRKTSWCTPFNRILQPRTNREDSHRGGLF